MLEFLKKLDHLRLGKGGMICDMKPTKKRPMLLLPMWQLYKGMEPTFERREAIGQMVVVGRGGGGKRPFFHQTKSKGCVARWIGKKKKVSFVCVTSSENNSWLLLVEGWKLGIHKL